MVSLKESTMSMSKPWLFSGEWGVDVLLKSVTTSIV